MKAETWKAIEHIFARHPKLRAEGVGATEIEVAETDIGIKLSDDYKQFVRRYGGAIVGPFPIFGLRRAAPMSKKDDSFVHVTRAFRRQRWPGTEGWAVISVDHAGNPVGLDRDGRVWITDHDAHAMQLLSHSFEGYVRKWCLRLPE